MRLRSTLPDDEANGLTSIAGDLVNNPKELRVVLAIIDVATLTEKVSANTTEPTVQVRRIELLPHDDLATAHRLLQRAYEMRTGKAMLPFELENELEEAFRGVELNDDEETP